MASRCRAESVALSWNEPTTNADGTPLTDLAGYKAYYGTTSGNYTTMIDVGNVLCRIVNGLSVGTTYYFAVTAYNVVANESGFSNEVSKTISAGDEGHCWGAINMPWKTRNKATGGFTGGFQ